MPNWTPATEVHLHRGDRLRLLLHHGDSRISEERFETFDALEVETGMLYTFDGEDLTRYDATTTEIYVDRSN